MAGRRTAKVGAHLLTEVLRYDPPNPLTNPLGNARSNTVSSKEYRRRLNAHYKSLYANEPSWKRALATATKTYKKKSKSKSRSAKQQMS